VETQVRSNLQHAWSAAVETVDFVRGTTLKIGGGDSDWKRFFKLASSSGLLWIPPYGFLHFERVQRDLAPRAVAGDLQFA
jgi:hypothetical protein